MEAVREGGGEVVTGEREKYKQVVTHVRVYTHCTAPADTGLVVN